MSPQDVMARRQSKNPNRIVMKNLVLKLKYLALKLLFSRVGPLVKALVSSILAALVTYLAGFGIMLGADLQIHIATAISGLIWVIIDFFVNKYAGDNVAAIQEAYGLKVDKVLGPITTAAAIDPAVIPRPLEILP